ncbi:tetratricopeptide repeat protein [Streptomyces alkaliphilus]|uniref:tetratricopeptide repeat protein n=1 Tax=Streptomyces alkaliphilus TaxID=1472722 RepID=UPI001E3F80EE|nr:tetratricopeptide repeat protein [Streptomyces alkaliphilus]
MASKPSATGGPRRASNGAGGRAPVPNTVFRALRGSRSPGEFASEVRRAAREIGEHVSCDARYIGRVESGEIRCPNYAYERVFAHMFPGRTLTDLGFAPRASVRGRAARVRDRGWDAPGPPPAGSEEPPGPPDIAGDPREDGRSDVLRRAFMTGGPAAVASLAPLGIVGLGARAAVAGPSGAGGSDAAAVEETVREIRLLDDRQGAGDLLARAAEQLRLAWELVDAGARAPAVDERLRSGTGELAISVGWLAHDSGRLDTAREHYDEALACARWSGDAALEAHAFCNLAFLARDANRPREAVRAAQAGQQAARRVPSRRLRALLLLREAGGWARLGDRRACEEALAGAEAAHPGAGPTDGDPEWMSFFGDAEFAGLRAQCWAALGEPERAAESARQAVELRDPHFVRNIALFSAILAEQQALAGEPREAAVTALGAVDSLERVRSVRVREIVGRTVEVLEPYRSLPEPALLRERFRALTVPAPRAPA